MTDRAARKALAIAIGVVVAVSACTVAGSTPAASPTPSSAIASPTDAAAPTASPTPDLRSLPLPTTIPVKGTVQDPANATLSLEETLKAGRAVPDSLIGADPVARFMLVSIDTDKDNGGFGPTLAWVFVAEDVKPITGTGLPTTSSPVPYHGTLSWTIIDMQGRMIAQWQNRYLGPNFPPVLPRS